jgi:hypothetical protein
MTRLTVASVEAETLAHGLTFIKERGAYSAWDGGSCLFAATTLKVFKEHLQGWIESQVSTKLTDENTNSKTTKLSTEYPLPSAESSDPVLPSVMFPEVMVIPEDSAGILTATQPTPTDRSQAKSVVSLQDATIGAIAKELTQRFTKSTVNLLGTLAVSCLVFLLDLPDHCWLMSKSVYIYLSTVSEVDRLRVRPRLVSKTLNDAYWFSSKLLWQVQTPIRVYQDTRKTLSAYRSLLTGKGYPLIG